MTEPDNGSIEGRGSEELLPARGDPFKDREVPSKDKDAEIDPVADVLPQGLERTQERDAYPQTGNQVETGDLPARSARDGGMQAVGPPLPEDLMDGSVPPPSVELELPPPPERDLASLISEVETESSPEGDGKRTGLKNQTRDSGIKSDTLLVSELRWKRLHAKADLLREKVANEIDNPHLKQLLLDQITIACDQELRTREQFEESERILTEVDGRISLEEQVQKWSSSLKTWVLAYELSFLCLSIIGLFLLPSIVRDYFPVWFSGVSQTAQANISTMARAMIWGGTGGSISALVGVWAHQEFDQKLDRQWAVWFFANPFMGLILGALIFLLSRAILVGIFPSLSGGFQAMWILYALCALAGFKQNVFYNFFDRFLRLSGTKLKKK